MLPSGSATTLPSESWMILLAKEVSPPGSVVEYETIAYFPSGDTCVPTTFVP